MQTDHDAPASLRERIGRKLGLINDDGEAEKRGPKGVKSLGPRPVRYVTAGQVRRAQERSTKATQVKTNRRYRRRWMDNRLATAILRGQLIAVGAIPNYQDELVNLDPNGHTAKLLEERYESVEKARERYLDILAEQAR